MMFQPRDRPPSNFQLRFREEIIDNEIRPTYLVEVDDRLPELVLQLVEVPHTDLSKVTRVVLVDVRPVVVLATSHTATTGMLAVLSDTSMTGGDVTATTRKERIPSQHSLFFWSLQVCNSGLGGFAVSFTTIFKSALGSN